MRVGLTLLVLAGCAGTFNPELEQGDSSSGEELSATASISSTSAAEDEGGTDHASGGLPSTETGSAAEGTESAGSGDSAPSEDSGGSDEASSGDPSPGCGDGVRAQDEECDGEDLDEATCQQLDMPGGGSLKCAPDCTFDVSGCSLGGSQPEDGLWSSCETSDDCDVDGLCEDNFCSTSCDASADCGPSPGGTAVAECRLIAPDDPDQGGHCYLSCENGESCPTNMVCWGASYCRSMT
jgi:hypothetical protein